MKQALRAEMKQRLRQIPLDALLEQGTAAALKILESAQFQRYLDCTELREKGVIVCMSGQCDARRGLRVG